MVPAESCVVARDSDGTGSSGVPCPCVRTNIFAAIEGPLPKTKASPRSGCQPIPASCASAGRAARSTTCTTYGTAYTGHGETCATSGSYAGTNASQPA